MMHVRNSIFMNVQVTEIFGGSGFGPIDTSLVAIEHRGGCGDLWEGEIFENERMGHLTSSEAEKYRKSST